MDIYFSGSISGGREDAALYAEIVVFLREAGHAVVAGEVASAALHASGESGSDQDIFERDLRWLGEIALAGGVLVAEVSRPSLGVGYEIAAARYRFGIPVVCLYRDAHTRRCSAMIAGDPGIQLIRYRDDDRAAMKRDLAAAIASLAGE
ncbi:MAG TPA: nucleoside 2-deoxyribosyltransferase [Thermoanaerobaculia bacterium]|nr:nucleoside 2-deoxyribosyltransferase [Thermoanaerobaculia bacterium]